MDGLFPREAIDGGSAVVTNLPERSEHARRVSEDNAYLEMAFGIEEEILGLEVAMCYALIMEIVYPSEDLFEAALDFCRRHASAFDSGVKVTAWTKFHDFAPMEVLILNEVDGLNDVNVMKGG